MRIREIKLNKFKRFTDLIITGIPETIKLVILVGPNGCGKTSVFEGLNYWYKYKGFRQYGNKDYYIKESDKEVIDSNNWYNNRVTISFHDANLTDQNSIHGSFYFRTAHRNKPDFTTNNLSKQSNPKEQIKYSTLMDTDCTVSENYQRLVSNTLSSVFNQQNDNKSVKDLREELIGKIKQSLNNVFDDLQLTSIGEPLVNGSFYFTKGNSKNFHYKNLSAGEKSAFDLLLDIVVKSVYFESAIYCIDEPEIHMHTALQAKLLAEIYNLIPNNSQLWLSTHSIGMLEKAKELEKKYPHSICFLDFSDIGFDAPIILKPTTINSTIWNKFLELAFGDFAKLIAPQKVVFCEGTIIGRTYSNFDAQIYSRIFTSKYPDISFVSIGSCSVIEDENNISMKIIKEVLKNSTIIKFVDRDDKSDDEIEELKQKGIKVLKKRHIECYLLVRENKYFKPLIKYSYANIDIERDIIKAQNVIFFGLSMGITDSDYFDDFFTAITKGTSICRNIYYITKNQDTFDKVKENIKKIGYDYSAIKQHIKIIPIYTEQGIENELFKHVLSLI